MVKTVHAEIGDIARQIFLFARQYKFITSG